MRRALIALAIGGGIIALGLTWVAGSVLVAPANRSVAIPEDMPVEAASIASASGELATWVLPSDSARGVIVLMHGVRADRSSQVDRMRLFHEAGYHVVAFDFQSSGESPGESITFGWRERDDAIAAVQFARERFPGVPLAIVGQSMGGAAAILAGRQLNADVLVVEAVYASVERATRNRLEMRLGRLGEALTPLLTAQLGPRLGVSADSLRPAVSVTRIQAPLFVLVGSQDAHAHPEEAQAIYDAAPNPKVLWVVEGAVHQDLYRFSPEAYRQRVLEFLGEHLPVSE
ncbi:MAG: alpha/beta fold hydrolase [Bacteroidota bacterium]